MEVIFIEKLYSRIQFTNPKHEFFLYNIMPELERSDRLFKLSGRPVTHVCPVCFEEKKWSFNFIEHLEQKHPEKLPENGKIFRNVDEDIKFVLDNQSPTRTSNEMLEDSSVSTNIANDLNNVCSSLDVLFKNKD